MKGKNPTNIKGAMETDSAFFRCDIARLLGLSLLHNLRLVKYRKAGKRVFYSLDDKHIENLFTEGLKHIGEVKHGKTHS